MVQKELPPITRPTLVDRETEVQELRSLADQHGKRLGILYGRRQVGKTYLLRHAWGDRKVLYFLAADQTAELNRADLLREMADWRGRSYPSEDYPTWRTVFRVLVDLAASGPIVVVIDEFQYLLQDGNDVTSQLVAVWDLVPQATPITILLSGSAISTMEHLASGHEPLYGRINWSHQLVQFDYWDAARMMPGYDPRTAAILFGIFGGTPRYLAALEPAEDLDDGTIRTIISPRGEVHLQMQTLLEQIQGLRDIADYRSVLRVAAQKPNIAEIVARTGLDAMSVRRKLELLEMLQLVRREQNFEAGPKAPFRYKIADNAVRFWYQFIHPERSAHAAMSPSAFWNTRVAPFLDSYMGFVFEDLVREAYRRFHDAWNLPSAIDWSRWEGVDRDRQSIEIDIAARLIDGRLLTGEIKWSSTPLGPALHTDLIAKLARLARSGYGWAKDTDDAIFFYASAAGFTQEMIDLAALDRRIRLVSLADLYPAAIE